MSRLGRVLAAILLAGLLSVVLTAGSAAADMRIDDPCLHNPSTLCDPPNPASSDLLPVNRWADSTGGMHGRLGTWDIGEKIQRYGTYPVLMSLGNSMWSGATSMTSAAIRMDILDAAGQTADNAAGTLGRSLISSGILALLVVVAIVVPLWRAARGQGGMSWGQVAKSVLIVGFFAAMVTGAQASTTTAGGKFEPGFMSPGWWAVTTNGVIAQLASAPAAALTVGDAGAGYNYDDTAKGALSCYEYVSYLKSRYATAHPTTQMESAIPMVMSGMWEATGLQVWATTQFGTRNPYGDYSYCRLLEQFAGTPAGEQRSITLSASSDPVADPNLSSFYSLAWENVENVQQDRTMVAWGMCRPDGAGGWKVADGWGDIGGHYRDGGNATEDCAEWWSNPAAFQDVEGSKFDDQKSAFEFKSAQVIYNDVPGAQARDYLLNLQGHTGGGVTSSLAMVYAYVFSSLVMLVVFGIIALSIIVAKVAALVMMIAVFFAMLLALWPTSGKSSLGKFFGQYVGMSLLVFGIQLVFAFLTLLTSMMVKAGEAMFGAGHWMAMVWTGFAPVISVIVLHMVFTKFLKIPSPFSMSGAQQWGSAAAGGAVGGAVGAGVMNRLEQRGKTIARSGGRAASRAALSKVSGGRLGGRGRPGARAGALVGGGAATGATAAPGKGKVQQRAGARTGAPTPPSTNPEVEAVQPGTEGVEVPGVVDGAGGKQTRAQRREAAEVAATERGAKNTVRGRYAEGFRSRWQGVRDQFAGKPVRQKLAAGAKVGLRGGAKVAGAGALILGTGGLAAPVMAAVWGTKHLRRTSQARKGAIATFEARKAAAELAAAEDAKKATESQEQSSGTGEAPVREVRTNGHAVRVEKTQPPDRKPIPRAPGAGHVGPKAPSAPAEPPERAAAPVPASRAEDQAPDAGTTRPIPVSARGAPARRGERPFGRK